MKKFLVTLFAYTGLALLHYAQAQDAAQPVTRAEVKSDARAAEKAGTIPRGQAENFQADKAAASKHSTLPRSLVKSQAKAAEKADQIPRGQESVDMGRDETKSTANRAEIKAETRQAEKSGQIPRGESEVHN